MKRLSLILAVILALACFALPLSADVGNVDWGGGGGGGGGYSGGGADFDWDDYGGGDSYYYSDDPGEMSVAGVVIVVAFIIIFLVVRAKIGQISSSMSSTTASMTVRQSGTNPITPEQEAAVVEQVRAVDPDFAAEQFRAYASDVILRVQEAWEARDWAVVRPYESDKLFAVHQRQLQEFIDQKKTNHMDGQYIQQVSLAGFTQDGANEVLTVRIDMSLSDYTTDDATGQIVDGVKNAKYQRAYRLEFIRSAGTKTVAGEEVKSHACPSCGAPLDLNAAGRCSYCDCVVTSGQYGWVLNAYNKW